MPDITMCKGRDCPLRESCYRYTATPSEYRQSYFVTDPIELRDDDDCDYWIDNIDRNKK